MQWIKELICKGRVHTWKVVKIENIDYRKYKTICVCKCCGKQITI